MFFEFSVVASTLSFKLVCPLEGDTMNLSPLLAKLMNFDTVYGLLRRT